MKKCASCSKDLPEAALHCVFCGAKQAAAPAVQPGLAKTAFGYSANEVMQQLGNPQPPAAQPQPQQSYQQPQQPQQPYQAPRPQGGSQPPPVGGFGGPPPQQAGGLAPPNAASAATIMVPPGSGPQFQQGPQAGNPAFGATAPAPQYGGYQPPAAQPYTPPAPSYPSPQGTGPMGGGMGGGGMGIHSPPQPTPAPLPVAAPPPYLASQTAARAGRPIEPWKDSLRFMMFVWGAVALAAFATPMSTDPMGFNWDLIIDGEGKMKIPPLIWATAGLLAIVCAAVPMATLPRGIVATVLGLAGIATPIFILQPEPMQILPIVGMLLLIPGLLLRHEYTESLAARVMVTIGVAATLVTLVIPEGGQIPLVGVFKGLIDAPGEAKVEYILQVVLIVLVVMSLLAWMPGPATAGAKILAWALILFPVADFLISMLIRGGVGDMISKSPGSLLTWAPGVTYSVLFGYGLATVVGKQLE